MLVILDRDGVINHESTEYVKVPDEWIPIEGSLEAIAALKNAGHLVVIMTNQAGIGRGIIKKEDLDAIHVKFQALLSDLGVSIDGIYFCPHHPDDKCDCRKPEPGMLKQIKKDFPAVWDDKLLIGDSVRDMQAGAAMGCPFWLVQTGYGKGFIDAGEIPEDVPVFPDLAAAVSNLLD
ncbi:MAG: D-glycero-beta-D-manno-heptose-1,7-bisphosphate 7-phosphatase [Coxiella sp. (in: Bacteria)]|nr:MAG: D-glycero-beta-D-manno-heptose-1,7-bisphosphate 7-phosphatase [Coxiella sp. (in: g-proteobacteria)]